MQCNEGVKSSEFLGRVARKDLFIVTKLPMMAMRPELVNDYMEESLKNLGLDYVDLYLVHTPLGIHRDEKTRFIKFYEGGKVKEDDFSQNLLSCY